MDRSHQPRTDAQIEASRANGALSRGPVTPEGKAISCLNNTRHNFLSNTILLPGESQEQFDRMLAAMTDEFEPQTEYELCLVEELAANKWRQLRVWSMCTADHTHAMETQAEAAPESVHQSPGARASKALRAMGNTPERLHRFEITFARSHFRIYQELKALRKERHDREKT